MMYYRGHHSLATPASVKFLIFQKR